MPARRPKVIAWEIIRLGKTGVLLGVVYAATEDEARAAAIEEYKINPRKVRLLVRRV